MKIVDDVKSAEFARSLRNRMYRLTDISFSKIYGVFADTLSEFGYYLSKKNCGSYRSDQFCLIILPDKETEPIVENALAILNVDYSYYDEISYNLISNKGFTDLTSNMIVSTM